MHRPARLVSGGQTGVDRAALDAAIAWGVSYGGWCPAGGWAEDHPHPPGLLAAYPGLTPTRVEDPAVRTRWNVRDSDATLVVSTGPGHSQGTDLTIAAARELHRPWHVAFGADPDDVAAWLLEQGPGLTLNVAGPRASEDADAYVRTRRLLDGLLAALPPS